MKMKDESKSTEDYQEQLNPVHVGLAIAIACVLAYLTYSGLKKIATVEATLPDELTYEPTEFTKQSVSDIAELLES
jgi:hypothetical protein